MKKSIFVVSSGKAYQQAEEIAAILAEEPGVDPEPWREEFNTGDITFLRIAAVARTAAGVVVVASPDDASTALDEDGQAFAVQVPRPNVVFEYGYFVSALGLGRVLLCHYKHAHLPSDLAGITTVEMGPWPATEPIDAANRWKIKTWARGLPPYALSELQQEIATYTQKLQELRDSYRDVLDGKVEHSRRNVWFQLDIVEERLKDAELATRSTQLCLLGVNATGPLHQGRELVLQLLRAGGTLRLLLLDPTCAAFRRRCDDEGDTSGRIAAEFRASLCIMLDIIAQTGSSRHIEIRLHERYPSRSLIMIDAERDDGIILDNPYPKVKGTRGIEGQMFPLVQRGRTAAGYEFNVDHFTQLWASARRVGLRPTRPASDAWAFEEQCAAPPPPGTSE